MGEVIDCGEIKVNNQYKLPITKHCKAHGIKEGDRVKVIIEKV